MVIIAEKIVNPLDVRQSDVHVSGKLEQDVISHDMKVLNQQYDDIRKHFNIPISRWHRRLNENWIEEALSLFPKVRSFTADEATLHKQGIKRVFKPTGRNLHTDDQ